MFNKKYIFESKQTRFKRILATTLFLSLSLLTVFTLLCVYIPIYSSKLTEESKEYFYQKSPDLIVVYTGDVGRIEEALKLSEKYPNTHLFISGVNSKNSLKTILEHKKDKRSVKEFLASNEKIVELDYLSRNTVENAISTLNHVRKNPLYQDVLIISSDYHLLRANLIMRTLTGEEEKYKFHYKGVTNNYHRQRTIFILCKEVYKLMKTSTFLLFWDQGPNHS